MSSLAIPVALGRRLRWLAIAGLFVILTASLGPQVLATVSLRTFTGVRQSDRSILLRWETASEIETTAFRLYRSESSNEYGAVLVTVPASGSVTGGTYSHTDPESNLVAGRTYYYRLEEIVNGDQVGSSFGPVVVQAASVAATYQVTASPTDVPTATRRFTNTPVPPTAAPTTPTPPPPPAAPRPPVTRAPSGPAAVTSPTVAAPVAVAPLPPTETPFIPTASPTPQPTDTPTTTPSPTLRPTATVTRTPAPLVFAAQSAAGEAAQAVPTAAAAPGAETGTLRSTPPMLMLAGAAIVLAAALGLLVVVMRRSARA